METVVIFDLDNCVSDDRHRIKLIDWSKTDPEQRYAAYHAKCAGDEARYLRIFDAHADIHKIIFLTARPETVRAQTVQWIESKLQPDRWELVMRNNGDHRPSLELKRDMVQQLRANAHPPIEILMAYDDRREIVEMYKSLGIPAEVLKIHDVCAYTVPVDKAYLSTAADKKTAADVLADMADTYRERNKVYGDNFRRVGHVMQALHPDGVKLQGALDHEVFHLWSLLIVKASRFAVSGLTHQDSIHDLAVYAAMLESILIERKDTK